MTSDAKSLQPTAYDTVEAAVRHQLMKALGGKRGMIEAAVPTLAFTISWLATKDMKQSLLISGAFAAVLLLVRLAQKQSVQFVLNSVFGIAIAAFFVSRTGDAADIALPGILVNALWAAGMLLSIVTRWPVVGFMVGSVAGDPVEWRKDPGMVKLCTKLTWLLLAPNLIRLVVQVPLYLAVSNGMLSENWVVVQLVVKYAMGWPLQIAAFAAMGWVLARGRTPVNASA
ncbi:DUF3159 domain-containing protein [Nonomuraea sp. NPDC050328]|uniref:DUF3159 domain-containing protein n=1 Tax=Nonomuraea sp. NPDC050328 TaxID=3364361 RepID=UPI0037B06431